MAKLLPLNISNAPASIAPDKDSCESISPAKDLGQSGRGPAPPKVKLTVAVVDHLTPVLLPGLISARPAKVIVLEGSGMLARITESILKRQSIPVEYPEFFMGNFRSSNGESAYLVARDNSYAVAAEIAAEKVRHSALLSDFDKSGRLGTIFLWLTKTLLPASFEVSLRLGAARALAGAEHASAWVLVPPELPLNAVHRLAPDMTVIPRRKLAATGWWRLMRTLGGEFLKTIRGHFDKPSITEWKAEPTVLTVREEDLVGDSSYRGQLHWLNTSSTAPPFRTLIMPRRGPSYKCTASDEDLSKRRVTLLSEGDIARCLVNAKSSMQPLLARKEHACLRQLCTTSAIDDRIALVNVWLLIRTARRISAVIEASGARAWVGCETYFPHADAVNLIADFHAMYTVAFQYGSIRKWSPQMLSTVDAMAMIGPAYAGLYNSISVGPKSLLPLGYPYSYAGPLVMKRAKKLKATLAATGAKFVICYFDESVQNNRWGFISEEHHLGELRALARIVLEVPDIAVLIKTKYAWNDPSILYHSEPSIQAARNAGRFRTVAEGSHRNGIFPAEAALAADICIGHAFGATAALESVIAGTPAILIRRYGEKTLIDHLLEPLDVVFPSIEECLSAIAEFRQDNSVRAALGDWSTILHHLDAGSDGGGAQRLREILEKALLRSPIMAR